MTKSQKRLKRESNKRKNKNVMRSHSKYKESPKRSNEVQKVKEIKTKVIPKVVTPLKPAEKNSWSSKIKNFLTRKVS